MSSSGLANTTRPRWNGSASRSDALTFPVFSDYARDLELVIGDRELHSCLAEIRDLRRRCGQEGDLTTEPEYFIAANTLANRRCAAVLIRHAGQLEACVLFFEHTRLGVGLGLFRGGDYMGESLVVAPEALRVHYVHLATQALLKKWRIHGVSLTVKAPVDTCIQVMCPQTKSRRLCAAEVKHTLPLAQTYEGMLAGLGPRTRRSLAGKRHQLEKSANVQFVPALDPDQALEVMLALEAKSIRQRATKFYHARYRLLRVNSDFYSMGLRMPNGPWLSILTGWRSNGVTYVDLQMNDMTYKRESISAVMRAFMLEHEIARKQELVNFVNGCSLLLARYCEPTEPGTHVFMWKPGLRAKLFEMAATRVQSGSVYERLKSEPELQLSGDGEN
jgi:hypothetical protein